MTDAAVEAGAQARSCLMIGGDGSRDWIDALRQAGFDTVSVKGIEAGRQGLEALRPDVVLLDLALGRGAGMALMRDCLRLSGRTRFVVISDDGSVNHAVEAMRGGACEFLVRPFDADRLITSVEAALSADRDGSGPAGARPSLPPAGSGLIGSSPAMGEVYAKIRSVSRSLATVFLHGESGTGKELCAQAIHRSSPRAQSPFVTVACGALPEHHAEIEIFGGVDPAGSGTGPMHPGAIQQADGGTLFLDEICEMSLALQAKMLRYLQTATIQPVGASEPQRVRTRIICATNRDPMEEVRAGRFRRDLYYRLHVVPIRLPPLRERHDDVIDIARHVLRELSAEEGANFSELSEEVVDCLRSYAWPGNVRELRNVLRRIVVLYDGPRVELDMMPAELCEDADGEGGQAQRFGQLIGRSLAEIEQIVIEETIRKSGGSVPKAARTLKVSPSTIYRKREAWKSV